MIEMPKSVATCFSARRAAASSRSAIRGDVGGQPGVGEPLGETAVPDDVALVEAHGRALLGHGGHLAAGGVVSCSFIGVPIFSSMCGWGRMVG